MLLFLVVCLFFVSFSFCYFCFFISSCIVVLCFFFFFQAEDGIRDHCVTGVQTCALPILVRLTPVTPTGDGTVAVAGRALAGAGRIGRLTTATTWYAGVLAERPLGKVPGADLNADGTNSDAFSVIVVKATDGWVAFIDTNLDGSFEDEMPLHDYRQGRETIALGTKPITLAANFGESSGVPTLAFVFDNNAHGTHVAGIAAGHTLFNVAGFDGVAPGAQLLGQEDRERRAWRYLDDRQYPARDEIGRAHV